jgi:hypothetical protein
VLIECKRNAFSQWIHEILQNNFCPAEQACPIWVASLAPIPLVQFHSHFPKSDVNDMTHSKNANLSEHSSQKSLAALTY